jgi:hypothetical protein
VIGSLSPGKTTGGLENDLASDDHKPVASRQTSDACRRSRTHFRVAQEGIEAAGAVVGEAIVRRIAVHLVEGIECTEAELCREMLRDLDRLVEIQVKVAEILPAKCIPAYARYGLFTASAYA